MDNNQQNKLKNLLNRLHLHNTSVIFVFLACGFFLGLWATSLFFQFVSKQAANVPIPPSEVVEERHFISPLIEADAALVYDPNTQTVLYEKNATSTRVLASITKLMTALIASPFVQEQPDKKVRVEQEDLDTFGESGLVLGEIWKLSDLLSFTLVTSSNDGAMTIAKSLMPYDTFIKAMNEKSKEIGADLKFTNPSGLDNPEETIAGATGSAMGVALLVADILRHYPQALEPTDLPEQTFTSVSGIQHKAINTNKAIAEIPQLIGGKTGFTDLAGGNLAVVVNAGLNRPVIIVVLGSTIDGRFADTEALASSTLQYFGS
jgi:D-alanyl-D-alanine carboxypeptidase